MKKQFNISIPKPCHEDWTKMTQKEKGRFCSSCSKTVIDFTQKSKEEIQDYLIENKKQPVCGHFYKNQLDAITIEILQATFQQQLSYQKLFILALLFVMGTTLFSCQYTNGKKQKIQDDVIVDTLRKVEEKIDSLAIFNKKDSATIWQSNYSKGEETVIDGDIDFTTVGQLPVEEEDVILGMIIDEPPRFKDSKNTSRVETRKDFQKRIRKFFVERFKAPQACLELSSGKYKIFSSFIIDEHGKINDIQVRAPHPVLKRQVEKTITQLPQFIPGKQAGKAVKTKYTLPISFMVE